MSEVSSDRAPPTNPELSVNVVLSGPPHDALEPPSRLKAPPAMVELLKAKLAPPVYDTSERNAEMAPPVLLANSVFEVQRIEP